MSENDGMTLLDKARMAYVGALPRIKTRSMIRQRGELALAYALGEINGSQFSAASGKSSVEATSSSYLMRAVRAGIIKCTIVPEEK